MDVEGREEVSSRELSRSYTSATLAYHKPAAPWLHAPPDSIMHLHSIEPSSAHVQPLAQTVSVR